MIVKTPPMGWNTWNTFGPDINETLVRQTADVLVDSGLKDAGYNYLVIDDCWSLKRRDAQGRLVADPEKFPSGMKALSDYVHGKGLKFGMYSCCGTVTCAGYPASYDHEFVDAATFAEWGVDFLKYDHCFRPSSEKSERLYRKMGLALANCGRDILFSACSWGACGTADWIKSTGAHMWRSTGDVFDNWESIMGIYHANRPLQKTNGHGCFNDMDMLVVGLYGKGNVGIGKGGCSDTEYRTHFSIWSMFSSPLMIGCDIRNMNEETKKILTNRDVIAINQDPLGAMPYEYIHPLDDKHQTNLWIRHLENGDLAILLINVGDAPMGYHFSVADLGIDISSGKKLVWRNLWTGEEGEAEEDFHSTWQDKDNKLQSHDCLFLRAKIVDR